MIQSTINNVLTYPVFSSTNSTTRSFKISTSFTPKPSSIHPKSNLIRRNQRLSPLAVPETLAAQSKEPISDEETKRTEVVVKKVEKPRLVLKFIWMEKNIGLALDQMIPGHGSVPVSPYFFWPRKDAWEELKATLESKPWISQKKMIILLNQATDIINLWQQSGGGITSS
ncbi:hypothetical protein K2173_017048 [Erythroxylum novogranatense]|uniref:30S ribosomal protein 3, chloroplastic n=1 Tax=Erythroxylum novogranatense TaxID=1862640 RepID=A0AAV8U5K8_9ROSI|nr:hypothetical protein K2173_017048 [Erythroxylum novogranatense]